MNVSVLQGIMVTIVSTFVASRIFVAKEFVLEPTLPNKAMNAPVQRTKMEIIVKKRNWHNSVQLDSMEASRSVRSVSVNQQEDS